MNILTITKLDETEIHLNIPENLNEITFGQLIELRKPDLTNAEVLSVLSGVPVDEIYEARSFQEINRIAKIYIDLFTHSAAGANISSIPHKIKVNYAGKLKTVKFGKYLSMEPAGAYSAANKVITSEIYSNIDMYGEDNWKNHFNPSLQVCADVVDAFVYCRVTGKLWSDQGRESFALSMRAADVLILAKHFFNVWPNLISKKPVNKLTASLNTFLVRFKRMFKTLLSVQLVFAKQR